MAFRLALTETAQFRESLDSYEAKQAKAAQRQRLVNDLKAGALVAGVVFLVALAAFGLGVN